MEDVKTILQYTLLAYFDSELIIVSFVWGFYTQNYSQGKVLNLLCDKRILFSWSVSFLIIFSSTL